MRPSCSRTWRRWATSWARSGRAARRRTRSGICWRAEEPSAWQRRAGGPGRTRAWRPQRGGGEAMQLVMRRYRLERQLWYSFKINARMVLLAEESTLLDKYNL